MTRRIVFAHLSAVALFAAGATVPAASAPKKAEPAAPAEILSTPMYRRYLHPDARAIAGVDLTRIAASPVFKRMAGEFNAMGWKERAAIAGMDFVSDVEKVMLSTPGEMREGGKIALSEEAPFVVAMQGKFKIDKLRRALMAKKASRLIHEGAEVWLPPQGDTSLAIVNSQVMLLGDRKSLRATLEAQAAATGPAGGDDESPVRGRAVELAKIYDVWFVSEASLEGVAAGVRAPQAEMLDGVDAFEFGVSFREGLGADLSLHGKSEAETAKLGTALAGLKALGAMAATAKNPEMADLMNKLKIGTTGERVMVSMHFTQKELDRGIDSVMAARSGTAPPKPAAEPSVPVAPPAPFVVRIYNADGGTREVPLQR